MGIPREEEIRGKRGKVLKRAVSVICVLAPPALCALRSLRRKVTMPCVSSAFCVSGGHKTSKYQLSPSPPFLPLSTFHKKEIALKVTKGLFPLFEFLANFNFPKAHDFEPRKLVTCKRRY